jgi:hypothetical protein
MEVQVLYADRNIFTGDIEWFDHVATVDAPEHYDAERAMEYAFRRLQNLDGSWSMGPSIMLDGDFDQEHIVNPDYDPNVTVLKPLPRGVHGQELGHRSCSMFDRMIVDGKIYEVDCIGFKEV